MRLLPPDISDTLVRDRGVHDGVGEQKITSAEMRDMGVRGILIYCQDYKCSHSIAISGL